MADIELDTVVCADCLDLMATMDDNLIDTIITDSPYGLQFMGKDWDKGVPGLRYWREALRVAKPGAFLLAFGGTRTWHRLACAIEDAGWELRDTVMWVYGQGFPKSANISKMLDKQAGMEREVIGTNPNVSGRISGGIWAEGIERPWKDRVREGDKSNANITAPATDAARAFDGYGTGLKPAWEPILVAMKPIDSTFAHNALAWGVAGLWIDGARVATGDDLGGGMVSKGRPKVSDGWDRPWMHDPEVTEAKKIESAEKVAHAEKLGRWPANILFSHCPSHPCPDCGGDGCDACGGSGEVGGCVRRGRSESDSFPYSFKDSFHIPIIQDSVNGNTLTQEVVIDLIVSWLSPLAVVAVGSVNFNNGIESGQVEVNEKSSMISNDHPLMDKLNVGISQLISEFKLNFWNGKSFSVGKGFTSMKGHLERVLFSAFEYGSAGKRTADILPLSVLDPERMHFKFFFADRTGKGDFISSVSDPEFVSAFFTTRFPGRFDRVSGFNDSDEFLTAYGTNLIDFSHMNTSDEIIHQQSSIVNVDDWECVEGCPCRILGEQSGERPHSWRSDEPKYYGEKDDDWFGLGNRRNVGYKDTGSAARFFYQAKSSRRERNLGCQDVYWRKDKSAPVGFVCVSQDEWESLPEKQRARGNIHPTIKPLGIVEYLARLTRTPTGGIVFDPFCGTGTTALAAIKTGRRWLCCDNQPDYVYLANLRIEALLKEMPQLELDL
jgi:DNA modification methylase